MDALDQLSTACNHDLERFADLLGRLDPSISACTSGLSHWHRALDAGPVLPGLVLEYAARAVPDHDWARVALLRNVVVRGKWNRVRNLSRGKRRVARPVAEAEVACRCDV